MCAIVIIFTFWTLHVGTSLASPQINTKLFRTPPVVGAPIYTKLFHTPPVVGATISKPNADLEDHVAPTNATDGTTPNLKGSCVSNGETYYDGEEITTSAPCQERCICTNGSTSCAFVSCPTAPPAFLRCSPLTVGDECCPKFDCPPVDPSIPESPECVLEGIQYQEGGFVPSPGLCTNCYCIEQKIVCAYIDCPTPLENCKPISLINSTSCCPQKYECDDMEVEPTTSMTIDITTEENGSSTCEFISCPPAPPAFLRCFPLTVEDECCPTFDCLPVDPSIPESPECVRNGIQYQERQCVPSPDLCTECYCIDEKIVCEFIDCPTPPENCKPISSTNSTSCCPQKYECDACVDISPNCSRNSYVQGRCKKTGNLSDSKPVTECLSPWFRVGDQCFLLRGHPDWASERRNWTAARTYCGDQGANLAQPRDLEALADYMMENDYPGFYYWLGGSDLGREGDWRWDNNTAITTGWIQDGPNSRWGDEDCLGMVPTYGANNLDGEDCGNTWNIICERH